MQPTPLFLEESGRKVQVAWTPPPSMFFKVNVDGSYRRSTHSAACGGLVRNVDGTLIRGFTCNLGYCNSVWTEMWALRLSIKLARSLSLDKVCFELDSKVVVNMIHMRNSRNKFLQSLLQEIIDLLDATDWSTSIVHVYREANQCAEHLTNKAHSGSFGMKIFHRASSMLALILREDALGFSIPRCIA